MKFQNLDKIVFVSLLVAQLEATLAYIWFSAPLFSHSEAGSRRVSLLRQLEPPAQILRLLSSHLFPPHTRRLFRRSKRRSVAHRYFNHSSAHPPSSPLHQRPKVEMASSVAAHQFAAVGAQFKCVLPLGVNARVAASRIDFRGSRGCRGRLKKKKKQD